MQPCPIWRKKKKKTLHCPLSLFITFRYIWETLYVVMGNKRPLIFSEKSHLRWLSWFSPVVFNEIWKKCFNLAQPLWFAACLEMAAIFLKPHCNIIKPSLLSWEICFWDHINWKNIGLHEFHFGGGNCMFGITNIFIISRKAIFRNRKRQ